MWRIVWRKRLLRLWTIPEEDEIPGDSIRGFALVEMAFEGPRYDIKAFEFLGAEYDISVIGILRKPCKVIF